MTRLLIITERFSRSERIAKRDCKIYSCVFVAVFSVVILLFSTMISKTKKDLAEKVKDTYLLLLALVKVLAPIIRLGYFSGIHYQKSSIMELHET